MNVKIITHGFDPELFVEKQTIKSTDSKRMVLLVSQLRRQRGIEILIDSIRLLPDNIIFILVGPILDKEFFNKIITDADLKKRIILTGQVPHEKIPSFISRSDICLFLDNTETSLSLFEYAVMGKPIIAFKGPIERRFVKDEEIMVCDWNPKSLADAIMQLLFDKEKAKNIGDKIKQRVITSYSWDSQIRRYIQLIDALISNV